jgi:uncharacterized cupredoxin-like copper-binding protein
LGRIAPRITSCPPDGAIFEPRHGVAVVAPTGRETFVVRNAADMEHELVVVKTALQASKLPVHGKQASEKGSVGEVEDIGAGKTKKLTLNLEKGHYALICNVPGHYKAGMHADFTVS